MLCAAPAPTYGRQALRRASRIRHLIAKVILIKVVWGLHH